MANHPRCLGPQVGNNPELGRLQVQQVEFDASVVVRVQLQELLRQLGRNAIHARRCTTCH